MAKELTKDEQKDLLILKNSYQMHLKTREEVVLRGDEDSVKRIDEMCNQILAKMANIDEDFAVMCYNDGMNKRNKSPYMNINDSSNDIFTELKGFDNKDDKKGSDESASNYVEGDGIFSEIDPENVNFDELAEKITSTDDTDGVEVGLSTKGVQREPQMVDNSEDMTLSYDIIPLPSQGECYPNKKKSIKVGYLTASDENIITSPNLYESGELIDVLLKRKVLDKDIDTQDLVSGDVDAILLFLRATAYGNDFPIETTIPGTTKVIKTTADLSKLKYKPFSLTGDKNGHFFFSLPRTKAEIEFKFLTKKEEKLLQKLNKKENSGIAAMELSEAVEKVKRAIKSDTTLSNADKNIIIDANTKLEKWSESLNQKNGATMFTKSVTNAMEMQIISINGNEDRKFIHDFVMKMPASDSLAFRRYLYDNQCGVDFEVEVSKPESMGGGSFKCFLEWDDYVFWTIG